MTWQEVVDAAREMARAGYGAEDIVVKLKIRTPAGVAVVRKVVFGGHGYARATNLG